MPSADRGRQDRVHRRRRHCRRVDGTCAESFTLARHARASHGAHRCRASERVMAALIAGATRTLYISRHSWPRLVEHGVGIYEYQPTMMHAKTVVDGELLPWARSISIHVRSHSTRNSA